MRAVLKNKNIDLGKYADCVNNGSNNGIKFYANGDNVSVEALYYNMTIEDQREQLEWFLRSHQYELVN